jgi:hypothetical protein
MSSWSGLDFFIFLILLLNTLLGLSRGATKQIIATLSLFAALVITIKFTIPLTEFVNSSPLITGVIETPMVQRFMATMSLPPLTQEMLFSLGYCISLLICFAGTIGAFGIVLSVTSVVDAFSFPYQMLNRKIGLALGALCGFIYTLVFIIVLQHLFMGNVPDSYFMNLFQGSAKKLDQLITAKAPERYKEILENPNLYNAGGIIGQLINPT